MPETKRSRNVRGSKANTGRPRKVADENLIRRMAEHGLPRKDIAALIGMDVNTLRYRFSHILEEGYAMGNRKLLSMAYTRATRGNEVLLRMLITKRMPKEYGERIQVEAPGDVLPGGVTLEMLNEKFVDIMQQIAALPPVKVASPKLLEGREVPK